MIYVDCYLCVGFFFRILLKMAENVGYAVTRIKDLMKTRLAGNTPPESSQTIMTSVQN